jgi:YidC/Oxa1 family membrane protein insertase
MSQQQSPANRLINFLLIGVLAYLGFFMIFNAQGPQDTRTADEIFKSLNRQAANLEDISLQKTLLAYERKVKDEGAKNRSSQEEILKRELAGIILAVDSTYKSALYRKEIDKEKAAYSWDKLNRAYNSIKPKWENYHTQKVWQTPFAVVPASRLNLPASTATPEQVYNRVVAELSKESRTHLVLGLLPGYQVIDALVKATGSNPSISYWMAGLLLALLVRIFVAPLSHKQIMWGRQMAQLTPYLNEIKEKYTDKKTKQITSPELFQAESMKLYKEYGINPLSGCGPALIQLPFFLIIYQCMLNYKFEFTKGHFLWIHPGATSFLGIPLGPNLGERDYILIALYGISMVATTLLQPVTDPTNARQQRLMGVSIAVFFSIMMFFWPLPSAFVVYWTFANILSTAQSLITYRLPMPELKKVATVKGGAIPVENDKTAQESLDKFFGKNTTPKNVRPKKKKG